MKLSYLDLTTTDPSYNLAMEQYVFDCLPRDRMYFMLWQNDNSIIVGKYQNTLSEINLEAVERRGIRVVRRLSGGGAVYHDMGNLNFTFITDAASGTALDMKLFCQPVVRTLAALGVHAEVNGRNDITIDGKKFSGNSQYLRQGRVMHHGTIMFNSDLSVVSEALQVDPTKFQTKQPGDKRCRSPGQAGFPAGVPADPAGEHSSGKPGTTLSPDPEGPGRRGEAARGAVRHLGLELWPVPCLHGAAPSPGGGLRPGRGIYLRGQRVDLGNRLPRRLLQRR